MRADRLTHILIVSELEAAAEFLMKQLICRGLEATLTQVVSSPAFHEAMRRSQFDVVVNCLNDVDLGADSLGVPVFTLTGRTWDDWAVLDQLTAALAQKGPKSAANVAEGDVLAAVAENTADGLFIVGKDGVIAYANQAAEKLCGLKITELVGRPLNSLWASTSVAPFSEGLASVLLGNEAVKEKDGFLRHRSGRQIPIHFNAAVIQDQAEHTSVLVTVRNVSELRRASADITLLHKQMDVERSHFETIMKQFPAGIVIAEAPGGRVVFFNEQAHTLLGAAMVSATCSAEYGQLTVVTDDGQTLAAADWPLTQALENGIARQGFVVRIPEQDQYLSLNATPILNSRGEITSAVLAVFDISAERRAQQSLALAMEEAERANHAKTAFLANMSHEMRTPLGAIIGFAGLLRSGDIEPEAQDETLEIIERNSQDLLRLIDEILDLSKVEAQKMDVSRAEHSLSAILGDVMSLLGHRAREKGLEISVKTESGTPEWITTDRTRLKQILVNLIGNAIKFTERGRIEIQVGLDGPLHPDQALVKFQVSDTGIGIEDNQRSRLFQPFSQLDSTNTRKYGGTGLGLLLSRKLAIMLGGDVRLLHSEPGAGSTFIATINAAPAREKSQDATFDPNNAKVQESTYALARNSLRDISILAADDSVDNQQLLRTMLSRFGAKVDIAGDGNEAVDKAVTGHYDVILMDLQMPGCDGYSATRRLRSLGFTKPILALSAHARQEEQEKSLVVGCNGHITKPINVNSLLTAIARHVGRAVDDQTDG